MERLKIHETLNPFDEWVKAIQKASEEAQKEAERKREEFYQKCSDLTEYSRQKLQAEYDQKWQEALESLQKEKDAVAEEKRALEHEKATMAKFAIRDNDVVKINCGGKKIMVKRSTICSVPGSVLAMMFNGRWEHELEVDEDGFIFLEYNPDCFERIVNFLRLRLYDNISTPAAFPSVEPHLKYEFNSLLTLLGLTEVFRPPLSRFRPVLGSAISSCGRSLVHDRDRQFVMTYIDVPYRMDGKGDYSFTVRFTASDNSLYVGFVSRNDHTVCPFDTQNPAQFRDSSLYDWCGRAWSPSCRSTLGAGFGPGALVECMFESRLKRVTWIVDGSVHHAETVEKETAFPCVVMFTDRAQCDLVSERSWDDFK